MTAGTTKIMALKLNHTMELLLQVVPGKLVIVVPNKDVISSKMPGGPDTWDQYCLVLAESRYG
jgi:hypothetical protein